MIYKSNQDFKKESLEILAGKWLPAIFVCIVVWFFATSADTFTSKEVEEIYRNGQLIRQVVERQNGLLGIINFFFAGPVYFGMAAFFLRLRREGNAEVKDVIAGFNNFLKYFLADLVMTIFIVLWTLLLIIPGILAYYRYSLTYYIMNDNPELTFMEAIERSKQLMDGNKMALFQLQLSFLGWFIIGLMTFGIGLIPLGAYYNGAKTAFYEEVLATENIRVDY